MANNTIYEENMVPEFELPSLLISDDDSIISDKKLWGERREEILSLFKEHVYGETPLYDTSVSYKVRKVDNNALGGIAIKKQVEVSLGNLVKMQLLMFFPKQDKKTYPTFMGYNFCGNQSIVYDEDIIISENWINEKVSSESDNVKGTVDQVELNKIPRGLKSHRYPLELIIKNGYGLITLYYGDVDPDFDDGFQNGIHALFQNESEETKNKFSSISAWSWGLSKVLDALDNEDFVDREKVIVYGHSRLGKTALWAGALDERFAMVISNNSGCGGAAISRRKFGETVQAINKNFPHWFNKKFKDYNDNEDELPIDQHMLIALIAPRPVYVASAEKDLWADPKGEFMSAKEADSVYRLLCDKGLNINTFPKVDFPSVGRISYHVRTGGHDLLEYDWKQYIKVADKYVK